MDITEAEDIKKRWQEYTEELYKKDLHIPGVAGQGRGQCGTKLLLGTMRMF